MTREEALELFKKASDVAGNYLEYVEIVSMHNINIVLSEIFNEHEAQLKAKDEEIAKYQMAIDKQSKRAEALKQLPLDKDEEIKKLKAEKESLCKTIKDLQTANTYWRIYHKDNQC